MISSSKFSNKVYYLWPKVRNNMVIAVNTRFLLKGKLEGIGWVTYELLRRMVQAHPEHQFLFLFDRAFDQSFIFATNVKGIKISPPARHPVLFYLWFEWGVTKVLEKEKADVFISLDGFLSLRTRVPTLLMVHDVAHVHFPEQIKWSERKYYEYFMPRFINKAQQVLTVSAYSKKDILNNYKVEETKVEVVYNGCRAHFTPLNEEEIVGIRQQYSDGKPYFFYVGALQPRKNIDRLIKAFDQFKQETGSQHLLLIGGRFAWKAGAIKSAYDSAVHQSDIHFLGYVSDQELPKLIGASFAMTYVSLFEGFGLPVLEALYCQVPVITSNLSSLPEVVGEAGLQVDPYQEQEIGNAMARLVEDQQLYHALKEKTLKQAQKFDWDKAARQVWRAVERIAN